MDIAAWRRRIDDIDRKLVELLNERAKCAHEIGRLKRNTQMAIYEPERERIIFENVSRANQGPLGERELYQVYERLIDVMRKIQGDEAVPGKKAGRAGTELEAEIND